MGCSVLGAPKRMKSRRLQNEPLIASERNGLKSSSEPRDKETGKEPKALKKGEAGFFANTSMGRSGPLPTSRSVQSDFFRMFGINFFQSKNVYFIRAKSCIALCEDFVVPSMNVHSSRVTGYKH